MRSRADEDGATADLVAEVAADDAADRAGSEADAQRREGEQRPGDRVGGREERRPEVEGSGGAVPDEVVVLDGRANGAADGDAQLRWGPEDRVPVRLGDGRHCYLP